MSKGKFVGLGMISVLALSVGPVRAQGRPASGLYRIISGSYIECCGIAGDIHSALPNESQSFIDLTVDAPRHIATMRILGGDMQTVFGVFPCPGGDIIRFNFEYGLIFPDGIVFHVDPGPPPYSTYWNYSVSNSASGLQLEGTLGTARSFCVDAPDQFSHSNVVAVLMPTAAIRVSEVEVCWNTASNRTYQVQYRSALTTNAWTDLGLPQVGDGSTNCVTDKVPPGQPQRFYRVLTMP